MFTVSLYVRVAACLPASFLLSSCGRISVDHGEKSRVDRRFETASVAGIFVAEGGQGQPIVLSPEVGDKTQWRWVICLDRSGVEHSGKIAIDLAKLSAPYTWTEQSGTDVRERHLDQITMNYSFKSELRKLGTGSAERIQETIEFHAQSAAPDKNLDLVAADIVAMDWNMGTIAQQHIQDYKAGGQPYYIMTQIFPFSAAEYVKTWSAMVGACATHGSEPFLQTGDQIPRG